MLVVWLGWNVGRAELGNPYYTAAVTTSADSAEAALFGTFDPGAYVTIDKPPASLWVPAAAVAVFGLSSWTVVGPSAVLLAVAGATLASTAARHSGRVEGWVALVVFAITPVVVVMGQANLPDTAMVAGMTAAFGLILTAFSWPRLLAASLLIGLSVLAKPAALLVVPAFIWGAWRLAPNKRAVASPAALIVCLLPVLAWVFAVQAVPEDQRPWIGGSPNNRPVEQIVGPAGIGRVSGAGLTPEQQAEDAAIGELSSGPPGLLRVFTGRMGQQAGWLMVVGLGAATRWRRTPNPRERSALEVWVIWFVVHAIAFSINQGAAHAYYALALVPPVAALAGVGAVELAKSRIAWFAVLVGVGIHGIALVNHTRWFHGWLVVALVVGIGVAVLVRLTAGRYRRAAEISNFLAALALLIPPFVFAIDAGLVHRQPDFDPAAGPVTSGAPLDLEVIEADMPSLEGSRWAVATADAMTASRLIAEQGVPAVLVGGFRGRDPIITAAELRGRLHDGTVASALLRADSRAPADRLLAESSSGCPRQDTIGGFVLVTCSEEMTPHGAGN